MAHVASGGALRWIKNKLLVRILRRRRTRIAHGSDAQLYKGPTRPSADKATWCPATPELNPRDSMEKVLSVATFGLLLATPAQPQKSAQAFHWQTPAIGNSSALCRSSPQSNSVVKMHWSIATTTTTRAAAL